MVLLRLQCDMIRQKQVNEYDVILLGSGLGSLVAGILLSRGKLSVLLLKERGDDPSLTREGYRFVPFSNFSEKIIRAPSLKTALSGIGPSTSPQPENRKRADENGSLLFGAKGSFSGHSSRGQS